MNSNDLITQVAVWPGFLDATTCERAIRLAQLIPPADGRVQAGMEDVNKEDVRRSEIRFFNPGPETEFIFAPLWQALQQVNQGYRMEVTRFSDGAQIARYAAEYAGHYDWHMDLGMERFSRRKISLSVQLSDGSSYDGGDLEFHLSRLDREEMRQRGTLIAFPSFLEHRVTPVSRGERYSLVAWVEGPPFR